MAGAPASRPPRTGLPLAAAGIMLMIAAPGLAQEAPAAAAQVAPEAPPADVFSHRPAAGPGPRRTASASGNPYRGLIEKEAADNGLAPEVAEAVMWVESGNDPGSVGTAGEIGLMQVMPSTARMLGFSGSIDGLADPATNIHYGVTYLAQAWRLAQGDICTATMKYRAGHGETRFSYLSVRYCVAVRARLAALGFAVTGTVPVATFGDPVGGGGGGGGDARCGRRCLGIARTGHVDLAALNTRLNAIVVQVRGGR